MVPTVLHKGQPGTARSSKVGSANPDSRDTATTMTERAQRKSRSKAPVHEDSTLLLISGAGSASDAAIEQGHAGPPAKKLKARRQAPPPPSSTVPVPCPRCQSEATKFCYYNNYDPQQPRYYCKDCQRYWTVGGVLRNVPPGSGRRKSRSAASREGRRHVPNMTAATTTTTTTTTENVEATRPEPILPANLLNSNPLASVLMSNLGLASPEASFRSAPRQGDSTSIDASNQTSDTTQRLGMGVGALPSGSVSAPMQNMLFSGSLFAPVHATLRSSVPASQTMPLEGRTASPFMPAAAAPLPLSRPNTRTTDGPASKGNASAAPVAQDPPASSAAQPAMSSSPVGHASSSMPSAVLGSASTAFSAVPSPRPLAPTAADSPALFGLSPRALQPTAFPGPAPSAEGSGAAADGGPLLPAGNSNMLPNMVQMGHTIQMLIAQNAAWLSSQACTPAADGGALAGLSMLSPGLLPGMPQPGGFFAGQSYGGSLPWMPMQAPALPLAVPQAAGAHPAASLLAGAAHQPSTSSTPTMLPGHGLHASPGATTSTAAAPAASLHPWPSSLGAPPLSSQQAAPSPLLWAPVDPSKGAFEACRSSVCPMAASAGTATSAAPPASSSAFAHAGRGLVLQPVAPLSTTALAAASHGEPAGSHS